jgi:opacity protein-like surface antigen
MKNVLGKVVVSVLSVLALSSNVNASSSEHSGGFYVVPKVVVIVGDTITHYGDVLNGDTGVGIGIDLGYSFTENIALELAATYVEADIKKNGVDKGDAEYTTYGANAVYSRTIIGHLRGLVKLGFAWEHERMSEAHIKETLKGATYAAGLEYGINDNMELVFEVEGANVTSSRGEGVMFGLKYKF